MVQTIEIALEETYDQDPRVRTRATRDLCPCEIKRDVPLVWSRLFELTKDPDINVRRIALHTLIDGSPVKYEYEVISALEGMRNDTDSKLRRWVRKQLARYRTTGTINLNE
jgi:HEAT repeat protein